MNLATNLVNAAERYGDRPAVRLDDTVLTYAELLAQAQAVGHWLVEAGLRPGDRVGLLLPNVPAYAVHFYGVELAGGTVVPMNPLLKAAEIEFYLRDSGATFLFTVAATAADAAAACAVTGTRDVVVVAEGTDLPPGAQDVVPRDDQDTAVILYTSGTTGKPKGAELTHDNIARNASVTARTLTEIGPADVVMGCLPLFHVFGLTCGLNAGVAVGACLTLISRFDGARALEVIRRDEVTVFIGVPTMYSALLQANDGQPLKTLRTCISGGAPLPVEVLRSFEETFQAKILEGYGLSESSPVACFNHPQLERKAGTIGVPVEDVSLRLVADDVDGKVVDSAPGEVGEILIKGPNVMKGYWGLPEATAETIVDGWLRTGDLATRDDDGYYTIVDRKKSLIIRGGYNVYPREIEEVIYEHPAVIEVAVVGIPHPTLGEEVAAAVSLKAGASASPEEIRAFVKERVAAYKYPREVWILDSLPKGPTGKILRREVQQPGA
ncbi:long-chain-fatty-acid--CoA ligase [Calidifontibacter terrae]